MTRKHKTSRPKAADSEYSKANRAWLADKAKEDGVIALPEGVYYRVITEGGSGKSPTPSNVVSFYYRGRTIDDKVFDTNLGSHPMACRLRDLIEGWIIAMQHMHVGDKWELFIPAELGYGYDPLPDIPAGSTLIFEVELLGIA